MARRPCARGGIRAGADMLNRCRLGATAGLPSPPRRGAAMTPLARSRRGSTRRRSRAVQHFFRAHGRLGGPDSPC